MPGDYLSDAAPLIYLMGKEDSVPATVRRKLSDPKSEVFYSHISIWDIQMKHQLGRLSMSDEPAVALHRELAATASACAPGYFRSCLVVQAKPTGSTLVSPDKAFSKYPVEVFL